MADIVLMPKMNLEMIEGYIGEWVVKEGDSVKKDDILCNVENEKEVAPVYSSYEGVVVKHIYTAGEACPVNKPICIVAQEGEDWTEAYEKAMAMKNEVKQEFVITKKIVKGGGDGGKMSPKIRKLLRENNIDADDIRAKFPDAKITEELIKEYLAGGAAPAAAASAAPADEQGDERVKMSTIRKTIANAMVQSCTKTARLTNFLEVDMTRVVNEVKALKEKGVKLSYTAIMIKACAVALKDNRIINTVLDDAAGEIVYKKAINVGCAIDSEAGLVVPVIQDADSKSCAQITAEMKALAEKVRERTLTAAERSGGTFTVSSIGMYDADFFTPIINYPQMAIMGVGRIKVVPRYTDDTYTAVEPRHVMEIGLTYDHRIIDGGPAMRYMLAVRDALEKDLQLD